MRSRREGIAMAQSALIFGLSACSGCSSPLDVAGDTAETVDCDFVQGPVGIGSWWAQEITLALSISEDGSGIFFTCGRSGEASSTRSVEGTVDWEINWTLDSGEEDPGYFRGYACAERLVGAFDFGSVVTLTREDLEGCCGCE